MKIQINFVSSFGARNSTNSPQRLVDVVVVAGVHPSAVRASGPTARPAHASPHLIDADLDAAFPRGFLLGRSDPTDPLVSRQRGDIGPNARGSGVKLDGFSEICWQLMDRAVREFLTGHTSKRVCSAQRDRDKPRQGVVAISLNSFRQGAVGFIGWLDGQGRQLDLRSPEAFK